MEKLWSVYLILSEMPQLNIDVQQFCSSAISPVGGDISRVILTVHYDSQQAVKQRLQALVSTGDDFVEDLVVKQQILYT